MVYWASMHMAPNYRRWSHSKSRSQASRERKVAWEWGWSHAYWTIVHQSLRTISESLGYNTDDLWEQITSIITQVSHTRVATPTSSQEAYKYVTGTFFLLLCAGSTSLWVWCYKCHPAPHRLKVQWKKWEIEARILWLIRILATIFLSEMRTRC